MARLLHHLVTATAERTPDAPALLHGDHSVSYGSLRDELQRVARGLAGLTGAGERVAIYLPKQPEAVLAMFGASAAGAVFVPINPVLKPAQVGHILRHCNVRVLVTSATRAHGLAEELADCPDLQQLVVVDGALPDIGVASQSWQALLEGEGRPLPRDEADLAAILYTSGSTGLPKGVMLSHRNLVLGAESVIAYLHPTAEDRLLAVLPFSFDYGLSQLTIAFSIGASVVLMDYLLPRDVILAVEKYRVTGLAAVPPLWNQLALLEWPAGTRCLRYLTSTGGAMPPATTRSLRAALPQADIYLMYGLTEAFRSTYLPPAQVDARPDSIGIPIPNAELMVLRDDGSECDPGEPGELVHRGPLVTLGYWNDPARTAERFRPVPGLPASDGNPELAVWSGDQVRRDADGYLYFESRKDEMIKTSGYRVSPTEVEMVACAGDVAQAVAVGVPHPMLGQAIVLVVQAANDSADEQAILDRCRRELPAYMVPARVFVLKVLPHTANGKIDRAGLVARYQALFEG